MPSGAGPRSPIGRRKKGREAPVIRFLPRKSRYSPEKECAGGEKSAAMLGRCWASLENGGRGDACEVVFVGVKVVAVWWSCSGALLVVATWLLEWCLVQNNDSKRIMAN